MAQKKSAPHMCICFLDQAALVKGDHADMEYIEPLWERLSQLHGLSKDECRIFDKPLAPLVPEDVLDRHGVLLSTAERLAGSPEFAIDWLGDALSLRSLAHWSKLRPACADLLRSFFAHKGNASAWIHFESCRPPILVQAPGLKIRPWDRERELPPLSGKVGDYSFRSADQRIPIFSLSVCGLSRPGICG